MLNVLRGVSTACSREPRILITGALGQLGVGLAKFLRSKYGKDNVIMSDIVKPSRDIVENGPYIFADILDFKGLQNIVVTQQIDWLIHFSGILSAIGEQNVPLAVRVNIEGVHNVIELSKQYRLKIFIPSSIASFGVDAPRKPTPNIAPQRPSTIYGVAKVHGELLGEYYNKKFELDFRCLRFPGVVSCDPPGGGTTDYAISIFYDAILKGKFVCYLRGDTLLPMMHIDDCLRATWEYLVAPHESLQRRTYNVTGMSFTPEELTKAIQKHLPNFEIDYRPDRRQAIADTWPQIFDDSEARNDWGWKHEYNLERLVERMLEETNAYLKENKLFNKEKQ